MRRRTLFQPSSANILASVLSSVTVATLLHPLDVLKTFQITPTKHAQTLPAHTLKHTPHPYKLAYTGLALNLTATGLAWGSFRCIYDLVNRQTPHSTRSIHKLLAASTASALTILISHPLFHVKTRVVLQAANQIRMSQNQTPMSQNQTVMSQNQTPMSQNQTPMSQNQTTPMSQNQTVMSQNQTPMSQFPKTYIFAVREPLKNAFRETDGIRGMYRGLDSVLLAIPNNAIQMLVYEKIKLLLPLTSPHDPPRTAWGRHVHKHIPHGIRTISKQTIWSFTAKFAAMVVTYPLNVIRIYQQNPARRKGEGTGRVALRIVNEEGVGALYKGFLLHSQRALLQHTLTFVIFERLQGHLARRLEAREAEKCLLSAPPPLKRTRSVLTGKWLKSEDENWESGRPFTILQRIESIYGRNAVHRRAPMRKQQCS